MPRKISIQYESAVNDKMQLSVTDSKGRLMQQSTVNITAGINQLYADGARLAAGVYILRLQTAQQLITQKIVKE
ncbi:MAG: T9SS type A sorting domain-containing protein [Ferruginibacter sp.]